MTTPEHPRATVQVADARRIPLPDNSVHTIVTSPPYLGLRSYNLQPTPWSAAAHPCDHTWEKHRFPPNPADQFYCSQPGCDAWLGNYGSEPSIEEYLQHTVAIFRELKRVLRKDGTLWLNIGDTYNTNGLRAASLNPRHNPRPPSRRTSQDPRKKDLLLMPARTALALQQDGWRVRAENIWDKPNSKPEAPTDRPRRTHEQVYLLTQNDNYFYDPEAVKTKASPNTHSRRKDGRYEPTKGTDPSDHRVGTWTYSYNPETVHLKSVWPIPVEPRPEAHFATFPERLADLCILAATSERGVCPQCGNPWLRTPQPQTEDNNQFSFLDGPPPQNQEEKTLWRPSCQHGLEPVPATVLDPFCGTGTTPASALRLGRRAAATDASPQYVEMAKHRLSLIPVPMI